MAVRVVTIGPDQDWEDPFGDWARASEVEDDGVVLVRPDRYVAWRSLRASPSPASDLSRVMQQILGRRDQASS